MSINKDKLVSLLRRFYYAIALLLSFTIIFILFPKQGKFKFEFQKGKPWGHQTLIAPFDFPILKPSEIVEAERDSLQKNFFPFFVLDTTIANRQISLLKNELDNVLVGNTEKDNLKKTIVTIFLEIYSKGVLENELVNYESLEDKEKLNVVTGNTSVEIPKSQLFSLKTAYLFVMQKLKNAENVISKLDFNKFLEPNLKYDAKMNQMHFDELMTSFSTTRGVVPTDFRVISQGDMVTSENYLVLESLRQAYLNKRSYGGWISFNSFGQMILIGALLAMLVVYLQSFNPQLFWQKRNFSLILTTIVLTFAMSRLILENDQVNLYLMPVCILPIIIRTFLGARNAIFIHLLAVLAISFMAPNSFEFVFIQSIAGAIAVISLNKLQRRGHLIITALLLIGAYTVMFLGFELVKEGDILSIKWEELKWFAASSLLLLTAYPLIFVFEKIFGLVSDVTLMELSDTNHPLLRQLSEIAPGTFQHSMQVANLSEEVIRRTGGNPMLVRTGALYHDVGKISSSQFFTENQSGNNPHDQLSIIESAGKIISHVTDGVVLARKHKIPETIIDFIRMHHGKSTARYFYLKYIDEHPNDEIDESKFVYPGPVPDTRETAVVMLADGVEAASRSLPVKNEETLKAVINLIIDKKVQNHELDNAPITLKDIKDIKAIFFEKLKTIYHVRIQYPKERN